MINSPDDSNPRTFVINKGSQFQCCLNRALMLIFCLIFNHAFASELSIGTISFSAHFDNKIENPNESHNGLYLNYRNWIIGGYKNSYNEPSRFIARKFDISRSFSIEAGIVDGYEKDINSENGYLPVLALSYTYSILNINLTPKALMVGFEFELIR